MTQKMRDIAVSNAAKNLISKLLADGNGKTTIEATTDLLHDTIDVGDWVVKAECIRMPKNTDAALKAAHSIG